MTPDGLIVEAVAYFTADAATRPERIFTNGSPGVFVSGHPLAAKKVDGDPIGVDVEETGVPYKDGGSTIKAYKVVRAVQ